MLAAFACADVVNESQNKDGDIRVSPDWKTITFYSNVGPLFGEDVRTFQNYCLTGSTYEACEAGPPVHRQIRER